MFDLEAEYISRKLRGCRNILSIGCGTGDVEGLLMDRGFRITGLDSSAEMIGKSRDAMGKVVGNAESLPFPGGCFDAVISVASLQFIDHYEMALKQACHVMKKDGRIVLMMINPLSVFFKDRASRRDSYFRRIVTEDPLRIAAEVRRLFAVELEFFLRIEGEEVSPGPAAPENAAILVAGGMKKDEIR